MSDWTMGIDRANGEDVTAIVLSTRVGEKGELVALTDDERLGASMYLGIAGPLSYNDTLRGAEAFNALLGRLGLSLHDFSAAYVAYRRRQPDPR